MKNVLYTIGCEKATLPQIIIKLKAAKVQMIVDVRAVAASRRAGFSKTILCNSLEVEGIAYQHPRSLGTPKPGREAARKGQIGEMEAIFAKHMNTPEAPDGLSQATMIVMKQRTALLCFEACASGCHRRIVANMIRQQTGCEVQHL